MNIEMNWLLLSLTKATTSEDEFKDELDWFLPHVLSKLPIERRYVKREKISGQLGKKS